MQRQSWLAPLAALCILLLGFAAPAIGEEAEAPAIVDLQPGPQPPPIDPPTAEQLEEAIARGVAFLLEIQNSDGSWGSATRTKGLNIYAPVPGSHHAFRSAVTALCVSALIETENRQPEVLASLERGEEWLLEFLPRVKRANPTAIYNVWSHAYAIQALARMHARHADDEDRQALILERMQEQVEHLERYESVDGGWGYYDFDVGSKRPASSSTSFVSATGLVALHEARELGVEVPQPMVDRAIASILRQQKPDFSYLYGEYMKWRPMYSINRPGGSLGRSQACNAALRIWGDEQITNQVLSVWLDRLFARNGWLDIGRKRPVPHESWFAVAGYFYYYGHYYAALCIELLPDEARPRYQDYLAHTLLDLQESDGCWWDYPLYNYHQQYGTALALMSLVRCRQGEADLADSQAPPRRRIKAAVVRAADEKP